MEKLNRKNFKSIMSSLSVPGKINKIEPLYNSGLLAIANVLLYREVSFFYNGVEDMALIEAINYPKRAKVENADYIFSDTVQINLLQFAKRGDYINPDLSSTLVFKCDSSSHIKVVISGPGIDCKKEITLPCDENFIDVLKEKNSNYPLGVEVYFLNKENELLALSRTTKVEIV